MDKKGCDFMAYYEALVNEAKELSEDKMKQVVNFIRFLKSSGTIVSHSSAEVSKDFHRTKSPLAGGLVFIADDFDETPDCFKEYI